MSWFRDMIEGLFGKRKRDEPPPAPRPVDPVYQGYIDSVRAPVTAADMPPTSVPPTPIETPRDLRAPFGRTRDGAAFASQAEADAYHLALAIRDANQAEVGRMHAATRYNGPVPVASLTDEEKAFLTYASHNFRFDPKLVTTQFDLWFAILNGPLTEINAAINAGDELVKVGYDPAVYTGRMRGYVDDVANGRLKPKISYPGLPAGVKDPTK